MTDTTSARVDERLDLSTSGGPRYAFVNGLWWDGESFQDRTFYTVDGTLRTEYTGIVDYTVDLTGKFVVPPLAESHTHWIDLDRIDEMIETHLADGIFYVRDPSVAPILYDAFIDRMNLPNSVDFTFAARAFVAPGGHPSGSWDMLYDWGVLPEAITPDTFDPHVLFHTVNEGDIERQFEVVSRERSDFVKIMLQFAEEHAERVDDPARRDMFGVDPDLVPAIVDRAQALGLNTLAHIYTVTDYRVALEAGIDEMVHLPGLEVDRSYPLETYLLTDEDAIETARRGVVVGPTVAFTMHTERHDTELAQYARNEVMLPNLRKLKEHGVELVLGSDSYGHTAWVEIQFLKEMDLWTPAELLTMATTTTSQLIFPDRKIGVLEDGYEASFLALDADPTENIDNLGRIALRVKDGRRLRVSEVALARTKSESFLTGGKGTYEGHTH